MTAAGTPLALHFRDQGNGPPIVILHGLFGSARNWQTIAGRLATDFRVISVDLRNHGESPHSVTMRYAEMAADVLALLDHQRIETCTLLGHSMGGKVAMIAGWPHLGDGAVSSSLTSHRSPIRGATARWWMP